MSQLQRTQIYIEKDQIQMLKLEAQKRDLAMAELIRRAIKNFLQVQASHINWNRDPLTHAIGKIRLGVSDASVNHDHYLYGAKKRK